MGKTGAVTEWRKTKKYNPSGPGYPEAGEYYVLMSEAEEKIEALEAELRSRECYGEWCGKSPTRKSSGLCPACEWRRLRDE